MFADSEGQGNKKVFHEDIMFGEMQIVRTPIQRHFEYI